MAFSSCMASGLCSVLGPSTTIDPQEAPHAGTLVVGVLVAGKRRVFVPCFQSELL